MNNEKNDDDSDRCDGNYSRALDINPKSFNLSESIWHNAIIGGESSRKGKEKKKTTENSRE